MSDLAKPHAERPKYRYPETLSAEQVKQLERVIELSPEQAEAYLHWLETGEGPDPCAAFFD